MKRSKRQGQPVVRCGKCGCEDCSFKSDTTDIYYEPPIRKPARIDLAFAGNKEEAPWVPTSFSVGVKSILKATRVEWLYTIRCRTCGWSWKQLVRETDHRLPASNPWVIAAAAALAFAIVSLAFGIAWNIALVKGAP